LIKLWNCEHDLLEGRGYGRLRLRRKINVLLLRR
jgi:hypothetical protein